MPASRHRRRKAEAPDTSWVPWQTAPSRSSNGARGNEWMAEKGEVVVMSVSMNHYEKRLVNPSSKLVLEPDFGLATPISFRRFNFTKSICGSQWFNANDHGKIFANEKSCMIGRILRKSIDRKTFCALAP
ncbi:MAG: hypothetical protein ACOX9C_09550 [Kiritimatiellia bacterium]|jgi:hypothetical protein